MASTFLFSLLLSTLFLSETATEKPYPNSTQLIRLGSSLSPETHNSWASPSGDFEFGFYRQEDRGFAVGIWIARAEETTIVWTANRDEPSATLHDELVFTHYGKLILRYGQTKEVLIANTTRRATFASMLDSGNFVLYDEKFDKIWDSFDHPTDSLLGGQTLPAGGQLIASLSETDHSTGRFCLKMQVDGNLVLYPTSLEVASQQAYWSSGTYDKGKFHLFLSNTSVLSLIDSTDEDEYKLYARPSSSNDQKSSVYRATVDVDGVFRVYYHARDENGHLQAPIRVWSALDNPCKVKGLCGFNSYCMYNDAQTNCLCVPGTDDADVDRKTSGCLRNYTELGCREGKENAQFHNIARMEDMAWGDVPYIKEEISMEECEKSCLEDCNCDAALFQHSDGTCTKQKLPLMYVRRSVGELTTAFFKLNNETSIRRSRNKNESAATVNPPKFMVTNKALIQILVLALGFILFSCASLAIAGVYVFKVRVLRYKRLRDYGALGKASDDLTLRAFSYNDLKRATNGFREELGKGSFGAVYKGSFDKGSRKLVAVKRLEKLVEEGEREFQAEMQAIGRTNHKNLVRLLGYCAVGSKRLLVYEYMSNGSLADVLFGKDAKGLDWYERVKVTIDIARGILYLHEECRNPIIHCDIKPQNILMDEFWTAKISDFGLAKLLMPDQTRTFTGIRGTRGYLAPEWQKNAPISVKADIYSYGIMLLEIVCRRKSLEINASNTDEIILSTWVFKCYTAGQLGKLVAGEEVDKKTLENMVKVGLWCIQDEPYLRPSMKSVVLMLEGMTDVSVPPCPTSTSM